MLDIPFDEFEPEPPPLPAMLMGPADRRKQIAALHATGMSANTIGNRVGITSRAVWQVLRRMGVLVSQKKAQQTASTKAERLARICELATLGYTAGQIADAIGVTRNIVSGLAHRNDIVFARGFSQASKTLAEQCGIPPVGYPKPRTALSRIQRPKWGRSPTQWKSKPAPRPVVKFIAEPAPEMRLIKFFDLTATTCHWPIGNPDEPDFGFCGADHARHAVPPYCNYHALVARQPPRPR